MSAVDDVHPGRLKSHTFHKMLYETLCVVNNDGRFDVVEKAVHVQVRFH